MQEEKDMSKLILTRYTQQRARKANKKSNMTTKVLHVLRMLDKKGLVNKDGKRIKL